MKRVLAIFGVLAIATIMFGGVASASEECTTDTTGWVLESPGPKWVQVDERTVVDQKAQDAVPGYWANLIWHNYTGNDKEYPADGSGPSLDDPNWHALPADPQSEVHSVPPRVPNVPYNVSNENSGHGSWFLWTGTWVPEVPAVEEVTHQEYKFEKTTCVDKPVPPKNPNNPNPPADNPPNADVPTQPELPHTGANPWLAAIGVLMVGAGAGAIKLTALL